MGENLRILARVRNGRKGPGTVPKKIRPGARMGPRPIQVRSLVRQAAWSVLTTMFWAGSGTRFPFW